MKTKQKDAQRESTKPIAAERMSEIKLWINEISIQKLSRIREKNENKIETGLQQPQRKGNVLKAVSQRKGTYFWSTSSDSKEKITEVTTYLQMKIHWRIARIVVYFASAIWEVGPTW